MKHLINMPEKEDTVEFEVKFPKVFLIEPVSKDVLMSATIVKIYVWKRTKYQEVAVVDVAGFGRSLIIDGFTQSTEVDEFIYHEALVHPAMVTHEEPKRVLIIGGGEGSVLREVLKHNTVKEAIMVDIDEEVIEIAKEYLECMHKGSFFDKRAKIVISDGKEYIRRAQENYFDVVIIDLTDPYSSEVARGLYGRDFYKDVNRVLTNNGVMVTQAGNSFFYTEVYDWVLSNIKSVFPITREYSVWVPSFGYACNFIIGSKSRDPMSLSKEDVDRVLRARGLKGKLKLYSGRTHIALLSMPILRQGHSTS